MISDKEFIMVLSGYNSSKVIRNQLTNPYRAILFVIEPTWLVNLLFPVKKVGSLK